MQNSSQKRQKLSLILCVFTQAMNILIFFMSWVFFATGPRQSMKCRKKTVTNFFLSFAVSQIRNDFLQLANIWFRGISISDQEQFFRRKKFLKCVRRHKENGCMINCLFCGIYNNKFGESITAFCCIHDGIARRKLPLDCFCRWKMNGVREKSLRICHDIDFLLRLAV